MPIQGYVDEDGNLRERFVSPEAEDLKEKLESAKTVADVKNVVAEVIDVLSTPTDTV